MAKPEKVKDLVRRLTDAGFNVKRVCEGSHTIYECGKVTISVPTGHREISPGVQRKVNKAIQTAS